MRDRPVTWIRIGDRYPDLKAEQDFFLALDDEVHIGTVRLILSGPGTGRWQWSLVQVRPGPAFPRPTNGTVASRGEAARALLTEWRAFLEWHDV